jgi:hypothetical protein
MSANVIPIVPNPEGRGEEWAELEIKLPPPRPWIPPGLYQARTVGLKILEGFDRKTIELLFDVYRGEWADAVVLAPIPMFLRVPGKKGLSSNSKLARLLYTIGIRPTRYQRVSLGALKHHVFFVEVADAKKDWAQKPLTRGPEGTAYSIIANVARRLA